VRTQFTPYQETINAADSILVVYGGQAALPAVAVASSLYVWFKDLSKKVTFVSPQAPVVEFCDLVGINKVKTKLPSKDLVITVPYHAATIDKVVSDLNPETNELSLIITPQTGQLPLTTDKLTISSRPAIPDLVFLIDVRDQRELAQICSDDATIWKNPRRLITLNDTFHAAPVTAAINEVLPPQTGFCYFWANFLRTYHVAISADHASNLLFGLEYETQHFQPSVTNAEVFELAAWLLRAGATRRQVDKRLADALSPEHHLPLPVRATPRRRRTVR
jgi:hypothetical protein